MPIYEYTCNTCRNRFEMVRAMALSSDDVACPECGRLAARALSVFASVGRYPGGQMLSQSEINSMSTASRGAGCGDSCGCAHSLGD